MSWINPKAEIRNSKINGSGLFAKKKIAKGEVILIQGGKIYEYIDIFRYGKSLLDVCFLIDENLLIGPSSLNGKIERDGAFLMNHSCEPNCGLNGQIVFVAMKDIKKNNEITYDYAMTDCPIKNKNYNYGVMNCNCRSKKCRKKIQDFDWANPILRKRYAGFFSEYITRKHNKK